MNDEGRTQREINEGGEAGRGKHGVREGGSVGGRDLRRREGGRDIRAGQAGEAGGEEGVKDGREETPMISARHGHAQKHASGC